MRHLMRVFINGILRLANVRAVNVNWGPRGFAAALLRSRKLGIYPKQIVDVGASDGSWTRECMTVFPESRYFLADPLSENEAKLKTFSLRYPNATFWLGAIGAEPGTLEINVHGDQSSLLTSEYAGRDNARRRAVEVRTLDSFLGAELQAPQLLKVDVQGFELEVLKGATKCLESTELLLLEVSYQEVYKDCPLAHEVIAYTGRNGFRLADICTYSQRPYDGALFQSDLLFARIGSPLFSHRGYA